MTGVGRNTNQEFTGCDTPYEHTFEEPSPVHQHNSPPQDQAQGQMAMDDLLLVVPQLISRIDSLETDLKQTKLTMGNAIVKLVKKVKKLEGLLKKRHVVLSDSEEEEPEAQGRKSQDDPLDSLVQGLVTPSTTKVDASGEEQVEDISPNTLEAAKTLSRVASLKPKSIDKGRRYKRRKETKGKKFLLVKQLVLAVNKLVPLVLKSLLLHLIKAKEKKSTMISEETLRSLNPLTQLNFEATKASLKRFGEELQTKTPKRLKDDEAKDDEPTKKSGKRRKQMARKGLHKDLDKDDSEDSDEVGEQEEFVTDMGWMRPEDELEKGILE
ncbi:hypothetical protein Tco_0576703, partial [Tanacetum coccineum]